MEASQRTGMLEPLARAERLLAQVATVQDAQDVMAVAEAARVLAERFRLGTSVVNHATVIKLRAERQLAELVDDGQAAGTVVSPGHDSLVRTPDKATLPDLGVSRQRLVEARQIRDAYTDTALLELAEQANARDRELRRNTLLRNARQQAATMRRAAPAPVLPDDPAPPPSDPRLLVGDFREVLDSLGTETVDAIITDPPYGRDALPLYGDLSKLAARVVRPDGIIVVMVGQYRLPDYLTELSRHLRYHWTAAYFASGDHAKVFPVRVRAGWKPLLIFQRPEATTSPWFTDVFRSGSVEKSDHPWQQSESGMADIIDHLTSPGMLILDPFAGSGTTGVAAVRLGRRFLGCDVDPAAIVQAQRRLDALPRGDP